MHTDRTAPAVDLTQDWDQWSAANKDKNVKNWEHNNTLSSLSLACSRNSDSCMTTCVNFSEARTTEFEAEYRDATQRVEICLSSEGVPSSKSQRVEQGDLVCELLCK